MPLPQGGCGSSGTERWSRLSRSRPSPLWSRWPSSPTTGEETQHTANHVERSLPCEAESRSSPGQPSHLYHRENVDEVQPLDLMRLQTMRTLHLREDGHELLCQRAGEQRTSPIGPFQFRLHSDWLKQETEGWAFGGLQEQSELTFSGRWWSFLGREDPRRCQSYRW